jgi:hypothetical protein
VIEVAETTLYTAAVVLNRTCVAPQKFVPVMVTAVPTGPPAGANDVIVGAADAVTVKSSAAVFADAMPLLTMTSSAAIAAPHGTDVVIDVSLTTTNVAATPPTVTLVTAGVWKFVPVIANAVPRGPVAGTTEVTVGATAHAGSAVTSTPTTPIASASAVARADTFLIFSFTESSPFL